MTLHDQLVTDVGFFVNPTINFNEEHQQYLFRGEWLQNVREEYFELQVIDFKKRVYDYLVTGLDNDALLKYLEWFTEEQLDTHRLFEITTLDDLQTYSSFNDVINPSPGFPETEPPQEDISYFGLADMTWSDLRALPEFKYFIGRKVSTEDTETEFFFQNFKLLYTLSLHKQAVEELAEFFRDLKAESFQRDIKAFAQLQLQELLEVDNYSGLRGIKCSTNMGKIELAHFFTLWMNMGKFYMKSNNPISTRPPLLRFIEANFMYQGPDEAQAEITQLGKEFSKIQVYNGRKSHIKYITELIDELEKHRDGIKLND